jgi:hypothetical protein
MYFHQTVNKVQNNDDDDNDDDDDDDDDDDYCVTETLALIQ